MLAGLSLELCSLFLKCSMGKWVKTPTCTSCSPSMAQQLESIFQVSKHIVI